MVLCKRQHGTPLHSYGAARIRCGPKERTSRSARLPSVIEAMTHRMIKVTKSPIFAIRDLSFSSWQNGMHGLAQLQLASRLTVRTLLRSLRTTHAPQTVHIVPFER